MSGDPVPPQAPQAAQVIGSTAPFIPDGILASAWYVDEVDETTDALPADRAVADTLGAARRASFLAGRRALRAALQVAVPSGHPHAVPWASCPIPVTPRGAPALPAAVTGSVSHKRIVPTALVAGQPSHGRAIAVAAPGDDQTIGVDLELRPTVAELGRPDIAPRILTPQELTTLLSGDALQRREATLLAFALKEAVYKAIDPMVQRYVGFTEVAIEPDVPADFQQGALRGSVTVRLLFADPAAQALRVRAMWQRDADWVIALARATRSV